MKENGNITKLMVLVSILTKMELFMKVTGSITNRTVRALNFGQTAVDTKENSKMAKNMVKVFMCGPTVVIISVLGNKTHSRVKELING